MLSVIKSYDREIYVSIGTNEELEFDNGKSFIDNCLCIERVGEETAKIFEKHFSGGFDPEANSDGIEVEFGFNLLESVYDSICENMDDECCDCCSCNCNREDD